MGPKDVKKPSRCDVMSLDTKESITMDLTKGFNLFNGNNAHGVQPFKGNRLSFVFFTTAGFWKVQDKERGVMTNLGFKFPTKETTDKVIEESNKKDIARAHRM